jgi:glycerophosphoryl diester phosphodiesterase
VVIHDFELESTTSGRGGVSEKCAAELAALDAGSHFAPRFAHIGIPTLEQVFDLVGDRCRINVEVKSIAPDGGPAAEVLLATLRRRSLFDQVIVSSFNVPTLTKLRALEPAVALGVLYLEPITPEQEAEWLSPALQPQALHPHYTLVSTEFVHRAHSHGLAVNVWTVNEVDDARALQQLGVDAIITDAPDLLMGHLMP